MWHRSARPQAREAPTRRGAHHTGWDPAHPAVFCSSSTYVEHRGVGSQLRTHASFAHPEQQIQDAVRVRPPASRPLLQLSNLGANDLGADLLWRNIRSTWIWLLQPSEELKRPRTPACPPRRPRLPCTPERSSPQQQGSPRQKGPTGHDKNKAERQNVPQSVACCTPMPWQHAPGQPSPPPGVSLSINFSRSLVRLSQIQSHRRFA